MGFWDKFKLGKSNQQKIDDFANMKDTIEKLEGEMASLTSIEHQIKLDSIIIANGGVIWQNILTDENKHSGFGSENNLKPQYLNALYKNCPLHAAIIDYYATIITKNMKFEGKELEVLKFTNQCIKLESDFDTFNDWVWNLVIDYLIQGNLYIKGSKNGNITKRFERLPAERMRVKGTKDYDVTGYAYNCDWISSGVIKNYYKYDLKKLDQTEYVMHYVNKNPDFKFYGEPHYISALNWLELDVNTAMFYTQYMTNGIFPSAIITFYDYPKDPTKFAQFKAQLRSLTDAGKKGRMGIAFGTNKDLAPDIKDLPLNKLDEIFLQLQNDIQRQICYAHGIDPMVMGLKTPGSLGNSNEVQYQTEKFEEKVSLIKKDICKVINKMIKMTDNKNIKFIL